MKQPIHSQIPELDLALVDIPATQLYTSPGVAGQPLDAAAMANIERILCELILDPIGPDFTGFSDLRKQ